MRGGTCAPASTGGELAHDGGGDVRAGSASTGGGEPAEGVSRYACDPGRASDWLVAQTIIGLGRGGACGGGSCIRDCGGSEAADARASSASYGDLPGGVGFDWQRPGERRRGYTDSEYAADRSERG